MKLKTALIVAAIVGAAGVALTALAFWAVGRVVITIQLRSEVPVSVSGPLTLTAAVATPVEVDVNAAVDGRAKVEPFAVDVDQVLRVPLNLALDVPLDAKVMVDEVIKVRTTVPIDVVITEKELDLSRLEIPIDDSVFVDDVILVNTIVAIDSTATTLLGVEVPVKMNVPVNLRVPIRQKVRVRDKLVIGLKKFRLPFHVDLPVNADVPFKQELRVSGRAQVPVRQTVAIPIKQRLDVAVPDAIPVSVEVKGHGSAQITSAVKVTAVLPDEVRARLGAVRFDASEVSIGRREE